MAERLRDRAWEVFKGRPKEWGVGRVVRRGGKYRKRSDHALLILRDAGVSYREIARIVGYGSAIAARVSYYRARSRQRRVSL